MKNKFKFYLYLYLVLFFSNINVSYSNELNFEAKNISSINDDIITASDEVVITDQLGNEIFADQLIIDNKKIYTISKNVLLKNSINLLEINSEKIIFDQNKNTFFLKALQKFLRMIYISLKPIMFFLIKVKILLVQMIKLLLKTHLEMK